LANRNPLADPVVIFVIGLLGTLLAVQPALDAVGDYGPRILGITVTVSLAYAMCALLLFLSIYSFALAFFWPRRRRFLIRTGRTLLLLVMALPPAYAILWVVSGIIAALPHTAREGIISQVAVVLLTGALAAFSAFLAAKAENRVRQIRASYQSKENLLGLAYAEQLAHQGKPFDGFLSAWLVLEQLAQSMIEPGDFAPRSVREIITDLRDRGFLPDKEFEELDHLFFIRNMVIHAKQDVTPELVSRLRRAVAKLAARMAKSTDPEMVDVFRELAKE
jgi:hypothetical protein